MLVRNGQWGELGLGTYFADPTGHPWKVVAAKDGWLKVKNPAGDERVLQPTHPSVPVRIFEPTEQEAIDLVRSELGGTVAMRMEWLGTQDERAARITVDVPRSAPEWRSHLNIMHGGVEIGVSEKDVEWLRSEHDRMHADPRHVMRFAHTHDPNL